jgi:hypothetical protein
MLYVQDMLLMLRDLRQRWAKDATLPWIVVTAFVVVFLVGQRVAWVEDHRWLLVPASILLVVGVAEIAEFLSGVTESSGFIVGRRSHSHRWRNEVHRWHAHSPMTEEDLAHLLGFAWVHAQRTSEQMILHLQGTTVGEYDQRNHSVVRRWRATGFPSSLLSALLHAGLSDDEVNAYLDAPAGSETRTRFEFLASLAAPAR